MKVAKRREDIILPLCAGRKVLDIGCAGQAGDYEQLGGLHERIASVAKGVVGVDLDEIGVKRLRTYGYKVVCGNAESIRLGGSFDVIVAGEVIEHVDNQGLFFENMRRHLKKGGKLVITTPNARFAGHSVRALLGWRDGACRDHVLWHTEETLEMIANRFGFIIEDFYYIRHTVKSKTLRGKIFLKLCRLLSARSSTYVLAAVLKKVNKKI